MTDVVSLPDPELRGVPLSVYAAVMAYLGEGVPLDRSLDHAGILVEEWPAIEAAWTERLGESAAEGLTLIDASDAHRASARAHVERALPPLDQELKAWLDFFRAFTVSEDPLGFLETRGMREGDVFRVLDLWQARIAAEPAVRDAAAALFAAEPGVVPEIRAGAPRLTPETRRARSVAKASPPQEVLTVPSAVESPVAPILAPKLSLAVTAVALPDLTKLPLPFARQGDKPIVFEAARPRVMRAPNDLGETKMAFTAPTTAALPFATPGFSSIAPVPAPRMEAREDAPLEVPVPFVAPPPRTPLAETSMVGFDLAKMALPFKAGIAVLPASTPAVSAAPKPPFGGTSLAAFEPPKAALPFASGSELTPPRVASPKASLAGTSLAALEPPKAALPFAAGASGAVSAPIAAAPPPAAPPLSSGTSLAAFEPPKAALPFPVASTSAAPPPTAPAPQLALRSYAILHAEIAASPANALATIARYGLTPEGKRGEDAAWQARFVTDPGLRMIWMRELVAAGNRLRGGQ